MNKLTLLFGVVLCLVMVNARHFADSAETETEIEEEETFRKNHPSFPRHRRRRWPVNYGYDYPYPYPDRRDSDRNNQEVIQQIYRLLDEINSNLRRQRPPPPPQPIYIPYPVPYYIPSVCNTKVEKLPNVTQRFPAMEDTNQNWGFVPEETNEEDNGDGSRPISFVPIGPKQVMMRPSPPVDHGSKQESLADEPPRKVSAFSAPAAAAAPPSMPPMCNAAVLSCCFSKDQTLQKQCFNNIGCSSYYNNGDACNPDSISKALDNISKAYSPVQ